MQRLPPPLQALFLDPQRSGPPEGALGQGTAGNAACGDDLRLGLWLQGGQVARARFQARGCSALIATAALLCEHIEGRAAEGLAGVDVADLLTAAGGLPARSAHAGQVVQRALDEAVRDLAARYP